MDEASRTLIDELLSKIDDPRQGLPSPVFEMLLALTPLANVDLLVKNAEGDTLLAWRDDAYGAGWHVPGGIIRFREPAAERIRKVAELELGAAVEAESRPCDVVELFYDRGHFLSLLFRCRLTSAPATLGTVRFADGAPHHGDIGWVRGVPEQLYPAHEVYARWLAGSAEN